MKGTKKSIFIGVVLFVGLLMFTGCSGETEATTVEEPVVEVEQEVVEGINVFEIIDRREDAVVADMHDDHWHGSLPEIPLGENISLGAYIEENGEEEVLDGEHHALGVALAEGAEEGIVSIDLHGDHAHITGEQEGTTQVVFQFIHDGEIEFVTPAIEVHVQ